ncbi:MAG: site-2 protease family protein [Chloroflexi bacterium]|nr:site-2 protease family protein [Chloroflexota bacterium]
MNLDPERLLQSAIAVAIIILISFPVHELSHALAAFRLGDSTARYMGRLTLNPMVHFDPLGGTMMALSAVAGVGIGWAKPTPVNPANLDGGRRSEALVALAGPLSNLIIAALAAIPIRLLLGTDLRFSIAGSDAALFALGVAETFIFINVILFVFNLLPIPPLDGWKVLTSFLDARTAYNLRQYEQYGFIVLILLIVVGGGPLVPIALAIFRVLLGI